MKKMILALALCLVQFPAFAGAPNSGADEMQPVLTCSNPELRDAGITVVIESGGIVPHLSAEVSQTSIAGKQVLLSVPMLTASREGTSMLYVDSMTRGQYFRLGYNPKTLGHGTSAPINAMLVANTQTGLIQTSLNCQSL